MQSDGHGWQLRVGSDGSQSPDRRHEESEGREMSSHLLRIPGYDGPDLGALEGRRFLEGSAMNTNLRAFTAI